MSPVTTLSLFKELIPRLQNATKLAVSKEESRYYHVHKILGVCCLSHYIYRFCLWGSDLGFGREPVWFLWALCGMHTLLSSTSLLFHIPSNRVQSGPMIWPEFRIHSIIFAYRSLAAMALVLADLSTPVTRTLALFATLIAADLSTAYYKMLAPTDDTTMRGMPFPAYVGRRTRDAVNLFYSTCQVFATLTLLYSPELAPAFLILFPIQIAAFLMTCVRKSIITSAAWHGYYTAALCLNYVHGMAWKRADEPDWSFWACGVLFCLARFQFRANKYVLWGLIAFWYSGVEMIHSARSSELPPLLTRTSDVLVESNVLIE